GTRTRLGITLAPDLLGREHFRQIAALLLFSTPMQQGGADQRNPLAVNQLRGTRAIELLVIDVLLRDGRAPSAILIGVLNPNPATSMHLLVPRQPLLPFFTRFVGKELNRERSFAMLIGQIGFKPVAKFAAENFVFVAESEIHARQLIPWFLVSVVYWKVLRQL